MLILYTRMTSVNNTNLLQTKYDCDVCNYHTCKKKDYNKHLLTAKHNKNTTANHSKNTITTSNENTSTTSNENTIINDIPNSELKNIFLEMITQRVSAEFNQQIFEKDQRIDLLGNTVFELIELIRNQDGTSREISKNGLSIRATVLIDDILVNDEQLSIIKANREQRELENVDVAEQKAELLALLEDKKKLMNDRKELTHNALNLIRQFK
jgi:hypothetical protein